MLIRNGVDTIMKETVEGEQVLFIQFITESRRRWNCGMSHKDEWASEGDLNPGLCRIAERIYFAWRASREDGVTPP